MAGTAGERAGGEDRHVQVVMAATPDLLPAVAVALRSVGETLAEGWSVTAHVFAERVPERSKVLASLQGVPVEVEWHLPSPELERLPTHTGQVTHRITYQRLFAPEQLVEKVSTFVHLDADVVVRRSLHHLVVDARLDEGDVALAAVSDFFVPFAASALGIAGRAELGLDPITPYFNAGVMGVDVAHWLELDLTAQALGYVERFAALMHMDDQEALNAVVAGGWRRLDPRWNLQAGCAVTTAPGRPLLALDEPGAELRLEADPWVVHFTAAAKPWGSGPPTRHAELWWDLLGRTAFAGDVVKERRPLRERGREATRSAAWLLVRGY